MKALKTDFTPQNCRNGHNLPAVYFERQELPYGHFQYVLCEKCAVDRMKRHREGLEGTSDWEITFCKKFCQIKHSKEEGCQKLAEFVNLENIKKFIRSLLKQ